MRPEETQIAVSANQNWIMVTSCTAQLSPGILKKFGIIDRQSIKIYTEAFKTNQ